ncbi:DNA repair protein RecN [Deinococcus metallilatus]|uniref:DNA repair protein RecN n=1 Tax=Deinococcus metallilatus TaxID=1211322 RepID=A0AAJ5K5B2_9DEIO|nr:DNA repair protein RecN [Deinococcus metallilatus]MBB5294205.1 DNA repair protein RecN (Recombination protein N) [Deinococcus metallilatus]QBY08984.1 DNA repair protein RecN [Deinococcus metallilatus]RXJ10128.1 DNA repair protein RecN [Deinococcus metallilatus]TLK27935.1 DNA repair protein RecN [Deinococcus metallilatus]GMA16458.1 DNA repair protein RecN [Deinococcus metallilatus]
MTRKARAATAPPAPPTPAPAGPPLSRLEVRNLATIRDLTLELWGGFSAFTGETGAGKSIIVDALGLLLGGRANTDLIRTGEDGLLVTGFWGEAEGEASASRRVTAQGRGTARLDGEVVSVRELQEWAATRLTIHWQHSAVSLLTPANQRALLDRQVVADLGAYQAAYRAWTDARTRLETLRANQRERARQLDLLTFQVREITATNPQPGEEEPLTAELTRLSNLETIALGAAGALELLSDGETSAAGLIAEAVRALNAGAKYDETSAQLQQDLRGALDSVQAVVGELRGVAEDSAPDPGELARVEARLSALGKLRAKYGPALEDVLAFQAGAEEELAALTRDEQDAGTLEAEVSRLEREVRRMGEALDAARTRTAGPLASQLVNVIRELGMPHARLEFRLSPLPQPGAAGLSDVTLHFTANPGEALGPLADVASGGELSRVMLAISTVLGAETPAVVFDEVDAGIGGAAALAVAEQLSRLARERQVLVVTHLAQIAARADHHYKVEKQVEGGRTVSRVRLLTPEERLEEIARMLGGNTSEAALTHARELLAGRAAKAT